MRRQGKAHQLLRVRVRSGPQEHADRLGVPFARCQVQGRPLVLQRERCAAASQHGKADAGPAAREPRLVPRMCVGASLHQRLHTLHVAVHSARVERGPSALLGSSGYVGKLGVRSESPSLERAKRMRTAPRNAHIVPSLMVRLRRQEKPHAVQVPAARRSVQWGADEDVFVGGRGASGEQARQNGSVAYGRCVVDVLVQVLRAWCVRGGRGQRDVRTSSSMPRHLLPLTTGEGKIRDARTVFASGNAGPSRSANLLQRQLKRRETIHSWCYVTTRHHEQLLSLRCVSDSK